MIVVINPSGSSGYSFKGLNAYCSHDQGQSQSAERVDWIDTRNLAIDDPNQAWKIMAATAQSQVALKQAAGIKNTGRKSNAHVQHIVLSFHKDEAQSPGEMKMAADELLANLGVDPAKSRGKAKPALRQFANEHQAVYYAHSDTNNRHLHIALNRVHPEHGVMLPSKNDRLKASKWAEKYSKRFGTDQATPNRSINNQDRDNGEYVKAARRKSRNIYEQDKALREVTNDNDRYDAIKAELVKKDASLTLRGRNMATLHKRALSVLSEAHQERKDASARKLKAMINKAKASSREEYRPARLALDKRQLAERTTFEGLEKTFFGRVNSVFKTTKLSAQLIRDNESGIITRSFRILTNAGARKTYFEKAQEAARSALARREAGKVLQATKALKTSQDAKLLDLRNHFLDERALLLKSQNIELKALKTDWKIRNSERQTLLNKLGAEPNAAPGKRRRRELNPSGQSLLDDYRSEFDQARQQPSREQSNQRDRGSDDRER